MDDQLCCRHQRLGGSTTAETQALGRRRPGVSPRDFPSARHLMRHCTSSTRQSPQMLPPFGPPARLAGGGSKCSAPCNARSAASAALQRWCRSRSRRRWAADRCADWVLKMGQMSQDMSILESYHIKLVSYVGFEMLFVAKASGSECWRFVLL